MAVECITSNVTSDVRCAVCGQGFLVYTQSTDRSSNNGRETLRTLVQHALRTHHAQHESVHAHPPQRFWLEPGSESFATA